MDLYVLSKTALFRGFLPEEVEMMLQCLQAEQRCFAKGERIYRMGDTISTMGIVLRGSVMIVNGDLWGSTTILDNVRPGQAFAEAYACTSEPLMVDVVAAEDAKVLFLNVGRVQDPCTRSCACHGKLLRNMLTISAQRNLSLSRKIFYTSAKSIRGRLMSYLSDQLVQNGSQSFDLPFNRQQLADYLNVDRSALSNELSKMQQDGLLKVERNHITLMKIRTKEEDA